MIHQGQPRPVPTGLRQVQDSASSVCDKTQKLVVACPSIRIRACVAVPDVGEIYKGKVKTITNFGAFIEILPGKDGLLHISEIDWKRTEDVEKVLTVGEEIEVKLIGLDPKTGKLKLSRKVLLPKPE